MQHLYDNNNEEPIILVIPHNQHKNYVCHSLITALRAWFADLEQPDRIELWEDLILLFG